MVINLLIFPILIYITLKFEGNKEDYYPPNYINHTLLIFKFIISPHYKETYDDSSNQFHNNFFFTNIHIIYILHKYVEVYFVWQYDIVDN